MLRSLLILFFAFGFAGCGKVIKDTATKELNPFLFPNEDKSINGAWKNNMPTSDGKGLTMNTNLYFNNQGMMGKQVTCEQFAEKLVVGRSFTALITGSSFKVDQKTTVVQKGEGKLTECVLDFEPGEWAYSVSFDDLQINDGKRSFSYTRIR